MEHRSIALVLACAALAGCPSKKPAHNPQQPMCTGTDLASIEQCSCTSLSDCPSVKGVTWACGPAAKCLPDCGSSQCSVAAAYCPATCQPAGCGDDSECIDGYQCIDGSCVTRVAPGDVGGCVVLPPHQVLNSGGTARFWVVANNGMGNVLPYEEGIGGTSVTWGVSGGLDATKVASPALPAGVSFKGGFAEFEGSSSLTSTTAGAVTAGIGGVTCAPAAVVEYPPPASGTLRVVAIDANTFEPVQGAAVIVGTASAVTTDMNGTASVASGGSTNTISVFESNHTYVTVADTTATDVLIPLPPRTPPGVFTGTAAVSDFGGLPLSTGTVHTLLTGASLAGNPNDFSFPAVFGEQQEAAVNFGAGPIDCTLPDGLALGAGSNMFKPAYSVTASPGTRAFWSLGGNADLTAVANAITAAGGSSADFVDVLAQVFPLTGALDFGVTSGFGVASGELANIGGSAALTVPLSKPQKLTTSLVMPALPTYLASTGVTLAFDEALVMVGAMAGPQGFVPLGLSGGVDNVDASGNPNPDQLVDSPRPGGPEGVLPANVAPRYGALEPFPYAGFVLATKFRNSYPGLYGNDAAFVLSGKVSYPGPIKYSGGAATAIAFGSTFLGVPNGVRLDTGARTLSIPTEVSGASMHRLDMFGGGLTWSIWFPAGESSVTIPGVPAPFTDPISSESVLQSISLGLDASQTFDSIFQFDGTDADDLTMVEDQFSERWVNRF